MKEKYSLRPPEQLIDGQHRSKHEEYAGEALGRFQAEEALSHEFCRLVEPPKLLSQYQLFNITWVCMLSGSMCSY